MRLIYLTSKRYPASTADHFFVRSMAKAFRGILGGEFSFLVRRGISDELKDINTVYINAPSHGRFLFYFLWLPFFVLKNKVRSDTVFFSNVLFDPVLQTYRSVWQIPGGKIPWYQACQG